MKKQRAFTVEETDSLRGADGKVRVWSDEFKWSEQVAKEQAILNPEEPVAETPQIKEPGKMNPNFQENEDSTQEQVAAGWNKESQKTLDNLSQENLGNGWEGSSDFENVGDYLDNKMKEELMKQDLPDTAYFINEKWERVQKLQKNWESTQDYRNRLWIPAIEEVKVEEKAPEVVDTQKQADTKVETVQDIKAKETSNEAQENELNEKKKTQVVTEMQQMIQNGSTLEEIQAFWIKNKQFKDDINTVLRGSFKNASNVAYFGKYSTLNNEDMYAAYQKGEVVPNSEQYNQLPPAQKARFDAFLAEKNAVNVINKTDYSTSDKVTDMTTLESAIPKMFSSNVRTKYEEKLNNPRIKELSSELTNNKVQIDDIDDKIEDLQDEIEKQAWPWALISQINSRYKQEYKLLMKDKRLLLRERQISLWEYQSLKSDAETELKISMYEDGIAREDYKTQLSLYESRRKERREDIASFATAANKAEAEAFKREQEIEDRNFEQKNKEIATKKALQNDIILADYKNQLAQGNIKGKWEDRFDWMYFLQDNWIATKVIDWGVTTDKDGTKTYTSLDKDGNPIFQIYDINGTAIWANTNVSKLNQQEADLLNTPAGSIIPTRLKTVSDTNTNRGKECAEYMNDIFTKTTWERMWDSYASKLAVANEQTGTLGSMAVWQPNPWNPSFSKFWHAWVIVWESEDGKSWHIKSSNIKWDWVISVDEVPKDVIAWYKTTNIYDTPIEDKQYSVAQTEFLKTIDVTKETNKEMKATISNLGLTEEDVFAFKSKDVPEATTKQFETLLQRLGNLKWDDWKFTSAEWFNEVVWFWLQKIFDVWEQNFIAGTDAANFAADLDTFLANITIDNLDKMTWVLTDKDLEILKWAGTALSSNLSEDQFVERITELEKVYKKALWQEVIETADVVFTDTDGTEYSNTSLKKELLRMIDAEEATVEEIVEWKKRNNIKL